MPKLLEVANSDKTSTPSILVTSGMLAKDPFPAMFSLGTCKAGQYNLVHSLHKEYEPKGVHCGLVVVGGTVDEKAAVTNPKNIAEETWKLFRQAQGSGQLEMLLTDPGYEEHVKNREKRDH
jgi:short-subunit dehydrogenase